MGDLARDDLLMWLLHHQSAEGAANCVPHNRQRAGWLEAAGTAGGRIVPVYREPRPLRIDRKRERGIGAAPILVIKRDRENGGLRRCDAGGGFFLGPPKPGMFIVSEQPEESSASASDRKASCARARRLREAVGFLYPSMARTGRDSTRLLLTHAFRAPLELESVNER